MGTIIWADSWSSVIGRTQLKGYFLKISDRRENICWLEGFAIYSLNWIRKIDIKYLFENRKNRIGDYYGILKKQKELIFNADKIQSLLLLLESLIKRVSQVTIDRERWLLSQDDAVSKVNWLGKMFTSDILHAGVIQWSKDTGWCILLEYCSLRIKISTDFEEQAHTFNILSHLVMKKKHTLNYHFLTFWMSWKEKKKTWKGHDSMYLLYLKELLILGQIVLTHLGSRK